MTRKLAFLILRVAVGGLFVYAALTKLGALDAFAEEIANYRVLPAITVSVFAAALPGVELLAGVLLIVGRWIRPAALLLTLLLGVFVAALSQALLRGINLSCGCFGGAELATWGTVARDGVIALATAAVALLAPSKRPDRSP